jgi:hypothetical protein
MDTMAQEQTGGTVGWYTFAAGTAGVAAGQSVRVSVVNLGSADAKVLCGLWSNPHPLLLHEVSYTLGPGEGRHCEKKASEFAAEIVDKTKRAQVRPFVRSTSRAVLANLEVFDEQTGRTTIILPLHEIESR